MARRAYTELSDELDRTAVLSEDFKKRLRLLVLAVEAEAYERGEEAKQPQHPEGAARSGSEGELETAVRL